MSSEDLRFVQMQIHLQMLRRLVSFGAEGIGLCRTEHMFFDPERIAAFREMICSETVEERETALTRFFHISRKTLEKLYEALEGSPVTIRFLDPPLHEFVPIQRRLTSKVLPKICKSVEEIKVSVSHSMSSTQ